AGERLAAFAQDSHSRAEELLSSLAGEQAILTIAAGRGAIRWVIPDSIRRASSHGRQVRVLTAGRDEAIAALGAGHADIAVTASDPRPRRFRSREVAAFPQVLIVDRAHPLAGRDGVRLADLAGMDLVVPPTGRPHRQSLERALLDAGVPWQPSAEADGWD